MKTLSNRNILRVSSKSARGLMMCLVILVFCLLWVGKRPSLAESQPRSLPEPKIGSDKTELDFGEIWADEPQRTDVMIQNSGNAPLKIADVKSSCSCTTFELDQREIAAGEKTTLHVKMDASEYSTNAVNTKVYVDSNDPATKRLEISVHAALKQEYVMEPETLDFGKVKKGSSPHKSILLRSREHMPVTLVRVEAPPELAVSFEKAESAASGSVKKDDSALAGTFRIDVTIKPETQVGKLNKAISLVTNVPRMPKREYRVSADVMGVECVITPKVVVFGPSVPGETIGSIEIRDERDFEVVRATSSVQDIVCDVRKTPANKGYSVALQLNKQASTGRKLGKVKLEIREGGLSEVREVAVYGEVK